MDYLQVTLIIVLGVFAVTLLCVGIYLIRILIEFKNTVTKANKVLDDVGDVTGAVSGPVTSLAGIISGVTESVKAVKSIRSLLDGSKFKDDYKEE
jgi:hypothetical protein